MKRSVSRFAAESLHPSLACERIRDGARRAVERASEIAIVDGDPLALYRRFAAVVAITRGLGDE